MGEQSRSMWNRLMMLLARGIVTAVNDATQMQTLALDLTADEYKDAVERFQDYGFTTHPPAGLEALVAFVGGNRSHGIVLAVGDRKFRLKNLQEGEVALYTDEGDFIHFKRGNKIEVSAGAEILASAPLVRIVAAEKVRAETPLFEVTGQIKDLCDSGGTTMSHMRDIFDAHDHNDPHGGQTSTPNQQM